MRYIDTTMSTSDHPDTTQSDRTTDSARHSPPDMVTITLFGVDVLASTTERDRLERVTTSAKVALEAQPNLLTRIDARDRENAQTRRHLINALESCIKALVLLDGPERTKDAVVALIPHPR